MELLIAIIAAAVIGFIFGKLLKNKNVKIKYYGTVQSITVFILIFFMGTKIGSDQRILESIKDIGVSALFMTLATAAGSLLFAYGLRKLLRLNREGARKND